jgi:hypothetical protein
MEIRIIRREAEPVALDGRTGPPLSRSSARPRLRTMRLEGR